MGHVEVAAEEVCAAQEPPLKKTRTESVPEGFSWTALSINDAEGMMANWIVAAMYHCHALANPDAGGLRPVLGEGGRVRLFANKRFEAGGVACRMHACITCRGARPRSERCRSGWGGCGVENYRAEVGHLLLVPWGPAARPARAGPAAIGKESVVVQVATAKDPERKAYVVSCPGVMDCSVPVPGYEAAQVENGERRPGTVYPFWWALHAAPEEETSKALTEFLWEVQMPTAATTVGLAARGQCEGMRLAARVHRVNLVIPCLRNEGVVEAGDELRASI